jgi:hypothetical protein
MILFEVEALQETEICLKMPFFWDSTISESGSGVSKVMTDTGLISIKGAGETSRLSVRELSFGKEQMNNKTQNQKATYEESNG